MKYTWTSKNTGAKGVLEVETTHLTEEIINVDGHKVIVPTSKYQYDFISLTINGVAAKIMSNIILGNKLTIKFNGQIGDAEIPNEILDRIYADERAEETAKNERVATIESAYDKHYEMVSASMFDDSDAI
jgi:hypothetical protein